MNTPERPRFSTDYIAQAAVIAALYTVLTMVAAGFDLASGAVQVRFSEALTILPYFTPAAVPGLTLGCLISNLVTGCALPDIIFGSLATLIPFILSYASHIPGGIPFFMLTVGAGEVISCMFLGQILLSALKPFRNRIFNSQEMEERS